jgi:tight adherence protein B
MTLLCLALAVLSVVLYTSPSPARAVASRLGTTAGFEPADQPSGRRPFIWRHRLWGVGCLLAVAALVVAHRLAGPQGTAVTIAALIVLATASRLGSQDVSRRRADRSRLEVAHACGVLASQVRVGRVPAEALSSAADDCPVLADASRVQDLGGDVTVVWRRASSGPGQRGLADLARAWMVSSNTGAPLAHGLEQVVDALTADVALRTVVAGELSAPRATGKIMAVLPFCGLGMGYLLGGDPLQFLLSDPYGWGCLVVGVALAAAGVLWIDLLSRRAGDQG